MIITKREFPNEKTYSMDYAGRKLSFTVGKFAELANAAVMTRYGDTTVLVACTASPRPKEGVDYFPLNVDFEEKLYAVGRIPGGFLRREGRPSEKGTLASRMIDRPMRPLFPSDLRNDVVISCLVLSVDPDCSPEITAMLGASAATAISDVPWAGPIGGVVLGWDGEKYLFNPTAAEKETSRMTVTIAATAKKVVMIEAEGKEIPEDVMYNGIMAAHQVIKPAIALIDRMVEEIGKPKFSYEHTSFNEELFGKIVEEYYGKTEYSMDTDDKNVREERWNKVAEEVFAEFQEEYPEVVSQWEEITYRIQKKVVKKWLLEGKRVDGRAMNQIRPLAAEVGVVPIVHGSGLFTRGQTQVLSICTLDTLEAQQKLDTIWPEETKRYIHHYNFPGYSTGEAKGSRSASRREIGHGALAEKALAAVIPPVEEFPYTIRVVSEVLSSNGSTSQGSVCGSTLALMDAGVPIKAPVAGISCGLISDGDKWNTFIDIQGVEDFHGEMDFKVAGTKEGITAIQMELKNDGLIPEVIRSALDITREARIQILDEIMLKAIPEYRKDLPANVPKMLSMRIDVEKIREVIGSGGKTIQKIVAESGAKVDVEEDGRGYFSSLDLDNCRKAMKMVESIVFVPETGALYYGKVTRVIPIGAFVELVPGKEGMVHIKDLEFKRTEKVEDVLNVGDMTWVKCLGVDERGRLNLSRKEAYRERERLGLKDDEPMPPKAEEPKAE